MGESIKDKLSRLNQLQGKLSESSNAPQTIASVVSNAAASTGPPSVSTASNIFGSLMKGQTRASTTTSPAQTSVMSSLAANATKRSTKAPILSEAKESPAQPPPPQSLPSFPSLSSASSSSGKLTKLQDKYKTLQTGMTGMTLQELPKLSKSSAESGQVFKGGNVGETAVSGKEIGEGQRFTEEDKRRVEQTAEQKHALVSQNLAFITRAEVEQLKRLKESGNMREYELLRAKLEAKRRQTEELAQRNLQSWKTVKQSMLGVLKQKIERFEKVEKELQKLVTEIAKERTITPNTLRAAAVMDDSFADVTHFSISNLMMAPEKLVVNVTSQFVDFYMTSLQIMDGLREQEWLYKNPLSASWNQLFVSSTDGLSWDRNRTEKNVYVGPIVKRTATNDAVALSGPHMSQRCSFAVELNLTEARPLLTSPPAPTQQQANLPGAWDAKQVLSRPATQALPSVTLAQTPYEIEINTLFPHYFVSAADQFYMAMDESDKFADHVAMPFQDSRNNKYTDGRALAFDDNKSYTLHSVTQLLPFLTRVVYEQRSSMERDVMSALTVEAAKLSRVQAHLEESYFKMMRLNTHQIEETLAKHNTNLFNFAFVSTYLCHAMVSRPNPLMPVTLRLLETFMGTSSSWMVSAVGDINDIVQHEMPTVTRLLADLFRGPKFGMLLNCWGAYQLLITLLESLVRIGGTLYPTLNRHHDFSTTEFIAQSVKVLRKLSWRVIFMDGVADAWTKVAQNLTEALERLTMIFYYWLKNTVFAPGNETEQLMQWRPSGPSPNHEEHHRYTELVNSCISKNQYPSLLQYRATFGQPGDAATTFRDVLNSTLQGLLNDTTTILPETSAAVEEAPELGSVTASEFELF